MTTTEMRRLRARIAPRTRSRAAGRPPARRAPTAPARPAAATRSRPPRSPHASVPRASQGRSWTNPAAVRSALWALPRRKLALQSVRIVRRVLRTRMPLQRRHVRPAPQARTLRRLRPHLAQIVPRGNMPKARRAWDVRSATRTRFRLEGLRPAHRAPTTPVRQSLAALMGMWPRSRPPRSPHASVPRASQGRSWTNPAAARSALWGLPRRKLALQSVRIVRRVLRTRMPLPRLRAQPARRGPTRRLRPHLAQTVIWEPPTRTRMHRPYAHLVQPASIQRSGKLRVLSAPQGRLTPTPALPLRAWSVR